MKPDLDSQYEYTYGSEDESEVVVEQDPDYLSFL